MPLENESNASRSSPYHLAIAGTKDTEPFFPVVVTPQPQPSRAMQRAPGAVHPRVRALYKEFLLLAPRYPGLTPARYREKLQGAFRRHGAVAVGSDEWKRCLARGRYELRNVQAFVDLHRFRRMKHAYDWGAAGAVAR